MNKKFILIVGLVAILVIAIIVGTTVTQTETKQLSTEEIKQLVQDYSLRKIDNESASITSSQLIVTDNRENKTTYDLPEDEFFVSIAPFINETHPCAVHNLTGCQGELVNESFSVYMEDTEGNIVIDETMETQANGFIDLWLPRNKTYHVIIEHDGKTIESELSTFNDDDTCITTMQLL